MPSPIIHVCVSPGLSDRGLIFNIFDILQNFIPKLKIFLKELASRIISVLEKMPIRFNGEVMWSSFYSLN